MAYKDYEEKPCQILHYATNNWSMAKTHYHDQYELNLSVSGGNRFLVNDKLYNASKGDLFLFSPNDLHKNMVPQGMLYERYLIFFTKESILPYISDEPSLLDLFDRDSTNISNCLSLSHEQSFELITLIKDYMFNAQTKYANNQLYLKLKIVEILLYVKSVYTRHPKGRPFNKSISNNRCQEIVSYIHANYNKEITLEHLSDQFHLSLHYLCDIFKKSTGFTVNQYLTHQRILAARKLLREGKTVSEVTFLIGYQNTSHFIRVFKKHVGVTPKQYFKD